MGKISLKWVAIFSIATNLLMIVPPLHMLQVYDRVLSSNSLETLIYITLIAVAAMVLFGAAEAVRGILAQRAAARYTVAVSDPLFARLSKNNEGAQESAQVLRDFNMVRGFIASRTLIGLFDLPFAPFFILLMFMLHWSLGVLTLIGLVILILVAWLNKVMTSENSQASKAADMQALSFAQAVFTRSEDIRAMGLLPAVMDRWGARIATALKTGDEATGQSSAFYGISKSVRMVLQIAIMGWGAYLVIQGEISGGVIFASAMLSSRALQPFEQVIGGWERITAARAANANLEEFLKGSENEEAPLRLPEPKGHISVENLNYSPSEIPNAKPVLDDVSFDLPAGKVLAIIGPSGAGKSTVAKALVGAIDCDSGQIRLDGAERGQWPEDQWGETVGYVSQEITLFPGSLAENIARLEIQPDPKKVIEAAMAAGIHDMITGLPEGYGTEIGPGKVMLSGGQKQRVALARALYSNPTVLVLDEPNAHLDAQGEGSLIDAMNRAKDAGRTIVLVTQRRSILQVADYIMTIKDGKIESFVEANSKPRPLPGQKQARQLVGASSLVPGTSGFTQVEGESTVKTEEMIALAGRQVVFTAARGGTETGAEKVHVNDHQEVTPERLKANLSKDEAPQATKTENETPVSSTAVPTAAPAMTPPVDHSNWQGDVPVGNAKVVKKGLLFVYGFLGLFLLWALLFPISSAVVSSGKMVSAGANKLIQHPIGGVVRQILVREGEQVEKGQVLLILDPAVSQAELSRLIARRSLLSALQTRLDSEQGENGFNPVVVSSGLQLRGGENGVQLQPLNAEATRILEEQRKEYNAGRKRLNAQLDAATALTEALKDQRLGLQARLSGAEKLLNYTEMELQKIRPLVRDGYLPKARLWELDRRRLEQVTAVGNFEAEVDATTQRISEAEAQTSQLTEADQEQRSEELSRVIGELAEIRDQIKAAQTAVNSTELRAPVAGTITKMTAHTTGGVVVPGAVVAEVVPKNSGLVTEFRVALQGIKAVKVGQKARVIITAFNRRTYDPIEAEVIYVSADQEVDPTTGDTYFLARARLNANPEKNNGLAEIQAGMQTEVFALSTPRVFMSYVTQPVYDSFSKAFRETN